MAALIRAVVDLYHLSMENGDPRTAGLPLMSSPWPVIVMGVLYVYFTTSIGQRWMANRAPFDCKYPMILYNIGQIYFNGLFVFQAFRIVWIPMRHSLLCEEVDYSEDPIAVMMSYYVWLYFFTKALDLLDTIFMVLRKKNNQISFLHVYHHTGMFWAAWVTTKFFAGGYVIFFGTVNAFVHTVMYSYYLVTALYPQYKNNIWWKRHITEIQLVQFVITAVHGIINFFNPNCNFPKFVVGLFIPQDIFMFTMFWDFYKRTYMNPKNKAE